MKSDLIYLRHILECIEKIEKATKNKTKKAFENSGIIREGVLYNLQVLSESTKRISKSLKISAAEIPWQKVSDFRNKLVHEYLGIDEEIIWSVIKKELPKLKKRAKKMIEFLEEKNS